MEDIQLYLTHNYLSFLISSIIGAGKAAIIICMSLTKETIFLTMESVRLVSFPKFETKK